jgi:hypothetical protein
MKTFIRVVEMWVPSPDQTLLEFGGGLFGDATNFAAISRDMCFGRGEGLPGQAWDEGRPVLLKQFEGSHFRRIAAAQAAGLTGGLAVPVLAGGAFKAVLVFYVGGDPSLAGALELWHNDPRITGDMTLLDGCYGASARALEEASQGASLPRGVGLPGMAWQREACVFMEDLGGARRFLRSADAAEAGIERGLAVPCPTQGAEFCVVALLSAPGSPVARRIECWAPDAAAGGALRRTFGFCETDGALSVGEALPEGEEGALAAQTLSTGVPSFGERAVMWPIASDEGRVTEVLMLCL